MDLTAAIGLISSVVTLEEAGRSWVLIVKDKLKRKEIDISNWFSVSIHSKNSFHIGTSVSILFCFRSFGFR